MVVIFYLKVCKIRKFQFSNKGVDFCANKFVILSLIANQFLSKKNKYWVGFEYQLLGLFLVTVVLITFIENVAQIVCVFPFLLKDFAEFFWQKIKKREAQVIFCFIFYFAFWDRVLVYSPG